MTHDQKSRGRVLPARPDAQDMQHPGSYLGYVPPTLCVDTMHLAWRRQCSAVTVPLVVLADTTYPLKPWLMEPYGG
ncbi:hypothetical protein Y1Q_0013337 [Alligator mississippiensis]|uniref:DDE Tnp4 domain-containing protein n=1 Tax=Alligator mississippiensis TaxID=8496 RepID=A0A151NGC4_ALLMI|nr:hypothetical protein Y1Q_0013337 [Alligator mississippiensis]